MRICYRLISFFQGTSLRCCRPYNIVASLLSPVIPIVLPNPVALHAWLDTHFTKEHTYNRLHRARDKDQVSCPVWDGIGLVTSELRLFLIFDHQQ